MEDPKRPPEYLLQPGTLSGPWILPDYLVQGAKFFKNHKIKNTAVMVIWFKTIKKLQKNPKSENFVFFYDSRDRSTRQLGVNHFLKNIHLGATDDTKSKNVYVFSWDDQGFLFLRTWKTHFLVFENVFFLMQ